MLASTRRARAHHTMSVALPLPALEPPLAPIAWERGTDAVLGHFLDAVAARGLVLYAEQEEAVLALLEGRHVLLNTPTGSGKSLVAAAAHFFALCRGRRSVYTCPIKALVNEKFLALCREFGPARVGLMTGDATVNPDAPILCCTAEILAQQALARGAALGCACVIMDEFHYYSDAARGVAWQVPLITLRATRFLLMSATLGDPAHVQRSLERFTGVPMTIVKGDTRPVPLQFEWSETPLAEKVAALAALRRTPAYLVHFTQRATAETAQALTSLPLCSREEKAALSEAIATVRFASPYGRELKRWLRHGIGVHHAGLLPRYRLLVESLAQRGLLKLVCGTDTLGVGINIPLRTVVFTQLWKYDGQKAATLGVRDFRQIAGRAGRRGFDDVGYVVIQAPEWVIANQQAEAKAAADPARKKKFTKQAAPEGAIGWERKTLDRLLTAAPEALISRFKVTHSMLLQVLAREEDDGCRALRALIAECHDSPVAQARHRHRAWQLFRDLVARGLVVLRQPGELGSKVRLAAALQRDFSLHQALSLYLLDTLPLLGAAAPDHALDVLTLCEAIVEDPDLILRAQVSKARDKRLAELKAEGVPYEERQAKLEEVEHPKPLRDFLYETFNQFAAAHPWLDGENVRPKSIAREMLERYWSFNDAVRAYGIERGEGLLLRHLMQVYKVLAQTVPAAAKTEAVLDVEAWLETLIRNVDSSVLDEWTRLMGGALSPEGAGAAATAATQAAAQRAGAHARRPLVGDEVALRRAVRLAIHQLLQLCAAHDWEAAAARLLTDNASEAVASALAGQIEKACAAHAAAREFFRLDPAGRATERTFFEWPIPAAATTWPIAQVLVDPQELNDWELRLCLDLSATRAADAVGLRWQAIAPVGGP
jgi:superfamily II RNA helicase